ncbi:hypothetical protein MPH_05795 [Macrophomina phaseolina MS6]|uniref:Uncharacterized protein n=1 Tax=Macrophomina phaseolina (strain MS6) TaxID=1126212 RepID=K2SJI2_MACPH|nr:hypothetical protein MPH_05795 [Macrophomina phaseolina MS6]
MSQQLPHRRAKGDLNFVFYSDHAQPTVEHPQRAPCRSSRLLFVEVRGARARRRQTLQYDRSTRELKSHVMLVTNEKRQRRTGDGTTSQVMAVSRVPAGLHAGIISDISQEHVDPFNALPVEGTPELHEALRYYFENYPGVTPLVDDDRVCHSNTYERERMQWSRVQFSICSNERASYYILLFAWQLMKDLSGNLRSMTFVTRRYWAWALQALREDMPIGKTGTSIPESYVGIVTCTCVASVRPNPCP